MALLNNKSNVAAPMPLGQISHIHAKLPTLLVVFSLTTMATVLIWNAKKSMEDFRAYQQEIMEQSVDGASNEIAFLIETLRASSELIVEEHQKSLRQLTRNPQDYKRYDHIFRKVKKHFPGFISYSIANEQGEVFSDDLGEKVGEVCRKDIQRFATDEDKLGIYVHPGPMGYHFDIIVPWDYGDRKKGFFLNSFVTTMFSRLLRDSQAPGHKLMLLLDETKGLIDITSKGVRDQMGRELYLSPEEITRITYSKPVEYTHWRLVDLPSRHLFSTHASQIVAQSITVFIGIALVSVILLSLIKREERRRAAAEQIVKDQLQEREEIVRDLHDDVGAKLLTLVHQCERSTEANKARSALQTLREIINRLGSPQTGVLLREAVADWRAEVQDRLEAAKIKLIWNQHANLPNVMLSPHQRIGLGRILREAVSNAIHHAQPSTIEVQINADSHRLTLRVCDNGPSSDSIYWSPHTGIANMRRRATELDGSILWRPNDAPFFRGEGLAIGTCVEVECPLMEIN